MDPFKTVVLTFPAAGTSIAEDIGLGTPRLRSRVSEECLKMGFLFHLECEI